MGWFGQDYGIDKYSYSAKGLAAGAAILKMVKIATTRLVIINSFQILVCVKKKIIVIVPVNWLFADPGTEKPARL